MRRLRRGAWVLILLIGLLWPKASQAQREWLPIPVPGLRIEIGPHFLLPQPPEMTADPLLLPDRGGRLSVGVQLSMAALRSEWGTSPLTVWGLVPEIGYVYQRRDLGTTSLFNIGMTAAYMPRHWLHFGYTPRFVIGRVYGADSSGALSPELYRLALGLRHGPQIGFYFGVVTLELSHQVLSLPGTVQHELLLLLGVDVFHAVIAKLLEMRRT